jgi:hypothetical protein
MAPIVYCLLILSGAEGLCQAESPGSTWGSAGLVMFA